MSIYLPIEHPAFPLLSREGWDVRPAKTAGFSATRILLVNQMPKTAKTATDVQWGRLLAASGEDVHITFSVPDGYVSKDGLPVIHYQPFSAIENNGFDGLVKTGAPLEHTPLLDITTWLSEQRMYNWAKTKVRGSIYSCWSAQTALGHYHGIEKRLADAKLFGIYAQQLLQPPRSSFALNLGIALSQTNLNLPVSRFCYADRQEIHRKAPGIDIVLDSASTHPGLLYEEDGNRIYSFNHPEYDRNTLAAEYLRDLAEHFRDPKAGKEPPPPFNYPIPGVSREGKRQQSIRHITEMLSSDINPTPPPWRPAGQAIVSSWIRSLHGARVGA